MDELELERLIREIESKEMLQAPKRLKSNILAETKSLPVQMEISGRKLSKNARLFIYGTKISIAVIAALLLLGVMNNQSAITASQRIVEKTKTEAYLDRQEPISKKLNRLSNSVGDYMNDLSDKMIIK